MRHLFSWTGIFLLGAAIAVGQPPPAQEGRRVRELAEKMKTAFEEVQDYSSEVEQIYFKDGMESERHRFKYFFKKLLKK